MWHLKNAKYTFFYYFISYVSKQGIPSIGFDFSVIELTTGTKIKMMF